MPRFTSVGHWAAVALLWIGVSGCDFVSTPDRFTDDSVETPVVAAVDYATIRSGQHLAGTVVFSANLDSLGNDVDYVALIVDGQQIDSASEAPYTLRLPTDQYPEGNATIGLAVYKRGGNQGLTGLVGLPALTLVTPVVFDQRSPTPVQDLSGTWGEDGVELRWTPNQDRNFHAYLMIREDTWSGLSSGGGEFGSNAVVIDTVYNASAAVYRDAAPPRVYGLRSTYRVAVSNRAEVLPSLEVALSYGGEATSISDGSVYGSTYHPTRDIAYHIDGSVLTVWRLSDATTITTVDLSIFIQTPELDRATIVGIREDGTELFVYASDPASLIEESELLVFSATETPSFLRRLSSFPDAAFATRIGPNGLLVTRVDSDVRVYDDADGQLQSTLVGSSNVVNMHRVGDRILTQSYNDATDTCLLTTYDPGTGASVAQATYSLNGEGCWNVYVMDGGRTLYLVSTMESRFRQVDGASLEISAPVNFPVAAGERVYRVSVSGNRLLLSVTSDQPPHRSVVLELEADGQTVVQTWRFASIVERIIPLADGDAFYAISSAFSSSEIWRVPRGS